METKRFIGNDMTRIFARVRRELGPDAVIVQTRSLLRDGADPLIEVLAAPGGGEQSLPLELQRLMTEGALARVETSGPAPLTSRRVQGSGRVVVRQTRRNVSRPSVRPGCSPTCLQASTTPGM